MSCQMLPATVIGESRMDQELIDGDDAIRADGAMDPAKSPPQQQEDLLRNSTSRTINNHITQQICNVLRFRAKSNPINEREKNHRHFMYTNWAKLNLPITKESPSSPQKRHKKHNNQHGSICGHAKSRCWSLVSLFWLPLVLLLLLPKSNQPQTEIDSNPLIQDQSIIDSFNQLSSSRINSLSSFMSSGQILTTLIRFPWDRIQLVSFGPLGVGAHSSQQQTSASSATSSAHSNSQQPVYMSKVSQLNNNNNNPVADRQDLVEEESHTLLLNPGETIQQAQASSNYQPYRTTPVNQQQHHLLQPNPDAISYDASGSSSNGYESVGVGQSASGGVDQSMMQSGGEMLSPMTQALQLQPDSSSSGIVEHSRQRTAPLATTSTLQTRTDLPSVSALNVKCEKNHMKVNIVFDRPFYGVVFSKGHYNDKKCVHLPPNSGQTTVNFEINMGKCGLRDSRQTLLQGGGDGTGDGSLGDGSGSDQHQLQYGTAAQSSNSQQPHGVYIENTIVIQYDSQVQEIYDQARRLRCTWYDYYEKSVTFRPYDVDMLDAVTANFLGDNIQCWMQIQVGKGPKSSEVAGLVKIGQTMTMVLAIKDDENRFDMLVRNCIAHDGKHAPIQLVDEYGCVARPKIMGQFQKSRNFGPQATVVSYAHFQAFKFPDSLSVHFQCVIQVCRSECPPLNCNDQQSGGAAPSYSSNQHEPGNSRLAGSQTVAFNMGLNSAASASSPGDYATSGTEVVATKEHLPLHHTSSMMMGMSPTSINHLNNNNYLLMPMNGSSSGHSIQVPPNYHQIKLDESQGRVQVKLDTSMLAGTRYQVPVMGSQALGGGAAPPSGINSGQSVAAATASGGLATPISGFQLPRGQTHRYQTGSLNSGIMSSSGANAYKPVYVGGSSSNSGISPGGRVSLLSGAGSSSQRGPQVSNYSPQYPSSNMAAAASMVQRAAYATNRIGELAPGARLTQDEMSNYLSVSNREDAMRLPASFEPESVGSDLSLLATPRALKSNDNPILAAKPGNNNQNTVNPGGVSQTNQHRFRRSLPSENQQSTSIQTQKTIQVISPEDVAFNLNAPMSSSATQFTYGDSKSQDYVSQSQMNQSDAESSTVCFSAARFLVGILFAMSLLIVSLVVVAILLFRQEHNNKLRKKELEFVTSPFGTSAACDPEPFPGARLFEQQPNKDQHQDSSSLCHDRSSNGDRLQQDSIAPDYRRTAVGGYLNRIYTQFSPHLHDNWH